MTRCHPIVFLAALLIVGLSATLDAIAQQATVGGHVRAEEGGAAVPVLAGVRRCAPSR
jgi:hypothetical protein